MIDAVLYGYNARGHLTLKEHTFADLRNLAAFFSSADGSRWKWAEVEVSSPDGSQRIVQYTADALRGMIVGSSLNPSAN